LSTRLDPRVHALAVASRAGWLTLIMRNVTWLGSSYVLIPVLVAATAVLLYRRDRRAARRLWVAFGGAVVLYVLAKPLVHRARPPATDLIGAATGAAYPSGHATQAIAVWGMLAIVFTAGRSARVRAWLFAAAAAVVLLVGASRVFLGAHWLTDVLAGYALGGAWLALLVALRLGHSARPSGRSGAAQQAGRPGGPRPRCGASRRPPFG
jgi:undecaprenyl-diphosphatase